MTSHKEDAIEKSRRDARRHNDIYREKERQYRKRNITKCNKMKCIGCIYSIDMGKGICKDCSRTYIDYYNSKLERHGLIKTI